MRDPSKFRLHFKEYKEGKSVREIYGLPGYEDGTVQYEKDGVQYNINPNVVGAELINVTTPEITVTGRDLTKPYDSAYLFNDKTLNEAIRKRMYNTITPVGYDIGLSFYDFITGANRRTYDPFREALWAKYLGLDYYRNTDGSLAEVAKAIIPSDYKMKVGNPTYGLIYTLNPDLFKYAPMSNPLHPENIKTIDSRMNKEGKNFVQNVTDAYKDDMYNVYASGLGTFTYGRGKDDAGKYMTFYDDWDLNFLEGGIKKLNLPESVMKYVRGDMLAPFGIGHPFTLADKAYYKNGKLPLYAGTLIDRLYKDGKLPGYKDGTKMQWDADAGIWRQVMDDPYADVFNNLVVTPKYIRPKFEYETNPNYKQPNKNEVVKPDETLWTRQQVEKANNTRTWLSDAANAMKYVQYASDAAGLLYGMAPGIKQRAAKAIYRNIVPASYKDSYLPGGKKQEVVNAIKDFFTPKKLDLDNSAYRKWEQENLSLFFTDTDPVAARDEIYKKYLGLPNDDFYYIKNADGTYSHNLANHEPHDIVTIINNTYNNDMGLSGKNQVLPDMLNSAGGWVNTSLKKVNDVLARFKYKDVWDVNPFQDADRVGNVFPKKLLNKYSHIEKLADGEEVRVWNKDVPWFIKKLQNFELSDFTNGAPVPVKTDINVRLLNPEEYSYTKKLTDTQIIEKMKQLDLSDAYDLYGDAMSDGIISEADWNEIELRVADKVYDTFYKDPNKYRKMFVYNVNHPLKKLFDWYGPFVLLRGYSNGKIRIKPANRGKFNATKKRTGKTTEELTHSKNPLTRKRAIFALNAKKWNHK